MATLSSIFSSATLIVGGVFSWLVLIFLNETYKELLKELGAPAKLARYILLRGWTGDIQDGDGKPTTSQPFILRGSDLAGIIQDRRDLRSMALVMLPVLSAAIAFTWYVEKTRASEFLLAYMTVSSSIYLLSEAVFQIRIRRDSFEFGKPIVLLGFWLLWGIPLYSVSAVAVAVTMAACALIALGAIVFTFVMLSNYLSGS